MCSEGMVWDWKPAVSRTTVFFATYVLHLRFVRLMRVVLLPFTGRVHIDLLDCVDTVPGRNAVLIAVDTTYQIVN